MRFNIFTYYICVIPKSLKQSALNEVVYEKVNY